MKDKKRLFVMAILGIGSFAASFGFSVMFNKPQAAAGDTSTNLAGQPSVLPVDLVAGTLGELSPRGRQLESLVRELRFKIEDYDRRERTLLQRERRLEMTQEILEQQIREIEALRVQLTAAVGPLKDAKAQLESTRVLVDQQEQAKFRRLAAMYDKMDVAQASQTITEMCSSGQQNDAAKLLLYMGERQAAKAIAEIPDKAMAAQLSLLMKRVVDEPAD